MSNELKFKVDEEHIMLVKKEMCVSLETDDGRSISAEELKEYLLEDTLGDENKDEICEDLMMNSEILDSEEPFSYSDSKGTTQYHYIF
ncbi:hypothetical protein OAC82_06440 [Gammaproteobacteria bacterium]|jgi:hypothetical protein|nr:hypothetical protein [Gammaproteobacteria bacterium]MDB9842130.1 hypothetical protein [Gammaproteobacteria bacterium]|tara:strand:- start:604 stop:867 length:264 start_codon:yes stop_codon:yes gene_type:complete